MMVQEEVVEPTVAEAVVLSQEAEERGETQ